MRVSCVSNNDLKRDESFLGDMEGCIHHNNLTENGTVSHQTVICVVAQFERNMKPDQ